MKALVPVLTRAGMRAVFNSERDGMQAKVSHIAFGDRAYSPSGEETKLHNERVRIPIAGGKWVGDFTIHMTALLDSGPSFWIKECGIVLDDGTLLAVWSDPDTPLVHKTDGVPIITAFDLTLEALPKSAVTVEAGDVDLTLFFAVEFARLAAATIDNMRRIEELNDRIDGFDLLHRRIEMLTDRMNRQQEADDAMMARFEEHFVLAARIAALTMTNSRQIAMETIQ